MIKTVFLVPLSDNNGQPHDWEDWTELHDRLRQLEGALSWRSEIHGEWRSGEQIYRDVSREYTVALSSWTKLAAWLAIVQWAKVCFRQSAMYVEVNGTPEIL